MQNPTFFIYFTLAMINTTFNWAYRCLFLWFPCKIFAKDNG